jgi:hypothetical protein
MPARILVREGGAPMISSCRCILYFRVTTLPYSTCIASPEVCTTQIGEGGGGKFEEFEKIAGVGILGIGGAIKAMEPERGIL